MADENPLLVDVNDVTSSLKDFLRNNPKSKIEVVEEGEHGKIVKILSPWGDPSVAIAVLPPAMSEIIKTLNNVHLPERYNGIWHLDSKDLELIFTAFPLGDELKDISDRKFKFKHRGKEYECEYAIASERMKALSGVVQPISQSATNYRNFFSFSMWATKDAAPDDGTDDSGVDLELGEPLCFYVKNVEWDDDNVVTLIRELNFYMHYFDRRSPIITIHSLKAESSAAQPRPRFRETNFPKTINSRELDEHLLRFWNGSIKGDPASRFLNSFRVIEYASVMYLDSTAKDRVRRLMCSPSALDDTERLTEKVVTIIQSTNMDPPVKFEALIREVIPPDILWVEINRNKECFNRPITFDGGFVVEPIMKDLNDAKHFGSNGITAFAKRVRDIRNALGRVDS